MLERVWRKGSPLAPYLQILFNLIQSSGIILYILFCNSLFFPLSMYHKIKHLSPLNNISRKGSFCLLLRKSFENVYKHVCVCTPVYIVGGLRQHHSGFSKNCKEICGKNGRTNLGETELGSLDQPPFTPQKIIFLECSLLKPQKTLLSW